MYRDSALCFEEDCPVAYVNLFDAVQFVNRRSELEGLPACYELQGCTGTRGLDLSCGALWSVDESVYDCRGFRLPTESEWEYAARAGTISATYAGEVHAQPTEVCRREPSLDDTAWYCCNSDYRTHPVAQKLPIRGGSTI